MAEDKTQQADQDKHATQEDDFVLTPEFLQYQNRRTDLILALFVLAFAFFLGSLLEDGSNLWLRLKTGHLIAKSFPSIPKSDPFAYTLDEGATWINPSWLFDWAIFDVYARWGDTVLLVLKVIAGVLAGLVLMSIRYPGPTLWWTAMCTLLGLATMWQAYSLSPRVVVVLLLASLLLLWHQARHRGRFALLYAAIPVTILWANTDLTYFFAPALLLLFAVGDVVQLALPNSLNYEQKPSISQVAQTFIIAVACLGAGACTPYGLSTLTFPATWCFEVIPLVPPLERASGGWSAVRVDVLVENFLAGDVFPVGAGSAWLLLILLTIGSFLLNFRHFQLSRLLAACAAAAMPLAFAAWMAPSSVVLAFVLSLNGQEFFLASFGREPRIDRGWVLWSQIGRAVSIILVFAAVLGALTGRVQGLVARFGFGIDNNSYMLAGNQYLKENPFEGNPFPYVARSASFLAYAQPGRHSFIDGRWHLFGDVLKEFSDARTALTDGKPEVWKPIFDKYGVTHVIVDPSVVPGDLNMLLNVPSLVPLYMDDDHCLILGRTDETVDKDVIAARKLDCNQLVFKSERPMSRAAQRYPEAPGVIDWVWRERYAAPSGVTAGSLYRSPVGSFKQPGPQYLSISKLRNAVAANPDNPIAHFSLYSTYKKLYELEAYQIAMFQKEQMEKVREIQKELAEEQEAAKSGPQNAPGNVEENAGQDAKTEPENSSAEPAANPTADQPEAAVAQSQQEQLPPMPLASNQFLSRHFQMMASLQYALTAGKGGPPSLSRSLTANFEMAQYATLNQFLDLSLEHLKQLKESATQRQASELQLDQRLAQLQAYVDAQMERYENQVATMEEELQAQGVFTDSPLQRAQIAMSLRMPLLALQQLETISPVDAQLMAAAAPMIAQISLQLGRVEQAEQALAQLSPSSGFATPQQMARGEWEWSMAQVRLMRGHYQLADEFLQQAIQNVRQERLTNALLSFENSAVGGSLLGALRFIDENARLVDREANFLFCRGMLLIEMGQPNKAKEHFQSALQLWPRFYNRGLIQYYWSLLTDDELPEGNLIYDPRTAIVRRIEPKASESKETGETRTTKQPDVKPAEKNADEQPTEKKATKKQPDQKKGIDKKVQGKSAPNSP